LETKTTRQTMAYLSINDAALSMGKRYTIITNKNAKGKKGSIAAVYLELK
jgi:hypothetical protein